MEVLEIGQNVLIEPTNSRTDSHSEMRFGLLRAQSLKRANRSRTTVNVEGINDDSILLHSNILSTKKQ